MSNEIMQSESIAALASALAAAQSELKNPEKSEVNAFFKSRYAPLDVVLEAALPALTKQGLCVIQTTRKNGDGTILRTILAHKSGEWVAGEYPIMPVKNDPQGWGSAITYARRYAVASIVGIAPKEEDDDGNQASNPTVKKTRELKRPAPPISHYESDPEPPPEEDFPEVQPRPEAPPQGEEKTALMASFRTALKVFKAKGANEERVFAALGIKKVEEISEDRINWLRGVREELDRKMVTIDDVFPPIESVADKIRKLCLKLGHGDIEEARRICREASRTPPSEKNPKGASFAEPTDKISDGWLRATYGRLKEMVEHAEAQIVAANHEPSAAST